MKRLYTLMFVLCLGCSAHCVPIAVRTAVACARPTAQMVAAAVPFIPSPLATLLSGSCPPVQAVPPTVPTCAARPPTAAMLPVPVSLATGTRKPILWQYSGHPLSTKYSTVSTCRSPVQLYPPYMYPDLKQWGMKCMLLSAQRSFSLQLYQGAHPTM